MKRFLVLLLASSALCPFASAAPKPITVKELTKVVSTPAAEGLVATNGALITYSNLQGASADAVVSAYSFSGAPMWQKNLDSGVDEVVTAMTLDPSGNIWLAGTSASPALVDTSTTPSGIENPDGVVIEPKSIQKNALNRVTIWKISNAGELLATYFQEVDSTPLINGLSVNSSGAAIVGEISNRPFLLTISATGAFSKTIYLGSSKTSINAVVRNSDGTISVFGSSGETLAGKKLVGVRDGILVKVSKSGSVATVVRSSAPKAIRNWTSADSSLLLSGVVQIGKVTETALTKFSPTFNPTWTTRVPSLGISTAITATTSSYLAISSKTPITGVSGWKPTAPQLLLLSYSSKGVLDGAWTSSAQTAPISLAYSKVGGLFTLALAGDQSVSIFHLTSR